MNRVVITGLGCITPIGNTVDDFRHSLFSGITGIAPIGPFPTAPAGHPGVRFTQMAQVVDFDPLQYMSTGTATATERAAQLGIVAARNAVEHSGLLQAHAPEDTAIILGCSCAGRQAEEPQLANLYLRDARAHPLTVVRTMANAGASHVSIDLGITGPVLTISTACASGTHAIGMAFHMVRSEMVSAAVAGGHDAPLTFGFLRAWDSMRVVSPTLCRPFSADRDGMTLGEGAAMFTLETLESAQARNATIYAEIVGFGMSADAHHITQPYSDGAAKAIRTALKDANASPSEVGYINAHGTGTTANDSTEAEAIHKALGPDIAPTVPISSTKSLHGHSIGATGAIEALATVLALHHNQLPFTYGVTDVDATLNLDVITKETRPFDPLRPIALSNSLAFGGLNAVLALRKFD
ncbi:3-oxoacyl-[acyl-carrier-protein] synthase II [Edaphobacter aggregans]|uniref:3-oxoacyl-[acyl-carrier-protein] synthase II n=1 Tax=Edaphobacter aggregans TaxID=570835 RepID=A0A3R9PTF6_9BACT|nr:beta-ketoacyl-[acyl-carrier-protein] synthase family protein [Edaphobacter aggregans]RSL17536.1 3-oxoacyl-[acyl-carrier-protein] synthase II [Edaphobacter aggregans]